MKTIAPKISRIALFLGLTCGSMGLAQAQPDVNNGPKADNPVNRPVGGRTRQDRIRTQLVALGVTDAATQQILIDYIEGETKATSDLMQKGQQLQTGLRGGILSDAQVAALLNDYQGALEDNKTRRAKSEAALKKALDLSKMPKVEATLTLMGIYGDGPNVTGVMNFIFNNRAGGRNGNGNGNGMGGNGGNGRNNGGPGNNGGNNNAPAPPPAVANPVF